MISLRKRLLNNRTVSELQTSKEGEEYTGDKKKEKQRIDLLRIAKFYPKTVIHGIKWYFFLLACFPVIFLLHAVFFTVGSQKHLDSSSSRVLSSDQKQKPLYYLSVVAIFKNEADVLKEWIDHHSEQGVDHFYLVNNDSTDDFLSVLAPFRETVTVINDSRKHAQKEIMNELFHDIKNQTEWIMSIDIDEYVYVRQSALEHYGASISSAVSTLEKENPKVCQLLVHWTMFGSSGHIVQPPSIRKNFTRCKLHPHELTKAIIKASLFKEFDIHSSRCLSGDNKFFGRDGVLALNHYPIMSWERFKRVKISRGTASHQQYDNVRDEGYFKEYDKLYSTDTCLELASRSYHLHYTPISQLRLPIFLPSEDKEEKKIVEESDDGEVNERCALCFFGLPRSYKNMVLPSITQNLLKVSSLHHKHCDIFVHYFNQTSEPKGRFNAGGEIDPAEILLLQDYVSNNNTKQHVEYIYDTDDQFIEKYQEVIDKYMKTVGEDGKQVYYPYEQDTWTNASVSNLVRQWHSIESVFHLMEESGRKRGINYTRVGMFRNDAVYLTPINIYMLDRGFPDMENKYVVLPNFALYPVNDRMIYGPFEAVKIWSTKRFELVEKQVLLGEKKGNVLHSENLMESRVIPAIEESGFELAINEDICFIRSRANDEALVDDCVRGGETRGFNETDRKTLVESIVGRNCSSYVLEGNPIARCNNTFLKNKGLTYHGYRTP